MHHLSIVFFADVWLSMDSQSMASHCKEVAVYVIHNKLNNCLSLLYNKELIANGLCVLIRSKIPILNV